MAGLATNKSAGAFATACVVLLLLTVVPANAQSVAGAYEGYFVCLPWGHVKVAMDVMTPKPGWLEARIEYSASLPPPPQPRGSRVRAAPGPSGQGSVLLGGWLDEKSHRFKLDWLQWGPIDRPDTRLLKYTFQTSIAGTYRSDDETFDGMLVYNMCGTFVATRRGKKLKAPATEVPRSMQEQFESQRLYHAILDEVEAAHRDRVLALPPNTRQHLGQNALRCGPYFLYYDESFMRKDPESSYLFFPQRGDIRKWPPFGYTVSFTPPDAAVSWIDEVETVSYGVEPRRYVPHSRGRRIPRADVTPVPSLDSFFHRGLTIKNRDCGAGTTYTW